MYSTKGLKAKNMLKAKVEWLEVRLGLRVTNRLLDKNRVETLDDDGKSLEQERRLANIPRCRTQPPTQIAQKVKRGGGDWPQSLKGYRLKRVAVYYYYRPVGGGPPRVTPSRGGGVTPACKCKYFGGEFTFTRTVDQRSGGKL